MSIRLHIYRLLLLILLMTVGNGAQAQDVQTERPKAQQHREATPDSLGNRVAVKDDRADIDAVVDSLIADSSHLVGTPKQDVQLDLTEVKVQRWVPDSKRALWLALAIPGGGQIYNRKYWKIPIIYGGFLGCIYAVNWNNSMYRDYSQAYIDIMDSDPNTQSYMNFLPSNYDVQGNMQRLKDIFKRKKDYYRRYRDLSIFCIIGVYALSVVDAYVDAELSSFEINDDLSMKIHPAILNDTKRYVAGSGMNGNSYGIGCSLHF